MLLFFSFFLRFDTFQWKFEEDFDGKISAHMKHMVLTTEEATNNRSMKSTHIENAFNGSSPNRENAFVRLAKFQLENTIWKHSEAVTIGVQRRANDPFSH